MDDMYSYKLLYIFILIQETSLCNIRICLTWSVNQTIITFKCRVHELRYNVQIVNQYHNALGHCLHPLPVSKCFPYYRNSTITQNASTNVTSLVIKGLIDNKVNGQWSCLHGTNLDEANVNVTVLKETLYSVPKYPVPAFGCLVWTNVPFFITIILARCILWIMEYNQERRVITRWCVTLCSFAFIIKFCKENYSPFVFLFVKFILMIFCSIPLFVVPLFIGTVDEQGSCTGYFRIPLLMLSISLGVIIILLLLSKGKHPQTTIEETQQTCQMNEETELTILPNADDDTHK